MMPRMIPNITEKIGMNLETSFLNTIFEKVFTNSSSIVTNEEIVIIENSNIMFTLLYYLDYRPLLEGIKITGGRLL